MDITDEAGAIAEVASVVADEEISLKNIGIVHNRDFDKGVLRVEFYEDETLKRAVNVLKQKDYRVYV